MEKPMLATMLTLANEILREKHLSVACCGSHRLAELVIAWHVPAKREDPIIAAPDPYIEDLLNNNLP